MSYYLIDAGDEMAELAIGTYEALKKLGNAYEDYRTICKCIEDEIRTDQIEGGMVGQYNPSITQRLNGLTEKQDVTTNGESINEIKVNIISTNQDGV
jgi:hypothetical protein